MLIELGAWGMDRSLEDERDGFRTLRAEALMMMMLLRNFLHNRCPSFPPLSSSRPQLQKQSSISGFVVTRLWQKSLRDRVRILRFVQCQMLALGSNVVEYDVWIALVLDGKARALLEDEQRDLAAGEERVMHI